MRDPVLHPETTIELSRLISERPQAILLLGAHGVGKDTVIIHLLQKLLGTDHLSTALPIHYVGKETDASLSIDAVRDAQHYLARKSGNDAGKYVVITRADRLGREAQNALLKTLEEPPQSSIIILSATNRGALLPTILSRVQIVEVRIPPATVLQTHFQKQGHDTAAINRALLMSGGLPGLTSSMLIDGEEHPLALAATTARDILRRDTFERLLMVESLSKQRGHFADVLFMLSQMARISLADSTKAPAALKQWRTVLRQATAAEQALATQAQAKLIATNLMLSL